MSIRTRIIIKSFLAANYYVIGTNVRAATCLTFNFSLFLKKINIFCVVFISGIARFYVLAKHAFLKRMEYKNWRNSEGI